MQSSDPAHDTTHDTTGQQVHNKAGPLAGLKVLELGTLIAGPFAARMMAEFGADVIKVETPPSDKSTGGDPLRQWRVLHEGNSLWWAVQARNKRSITLNLKHPDAQAIARELALQADIVIENYRPGILETWGLGYEQLKALKPSLIMVRLSGYGQSGPMRDLPGFGAVAESMGGLRYVSGHADRPPVRVGISIGDSIAALHAVIGALMALHHRNATGGAQHGQGQMVDVALYESVFNLMESLVPEYDHAGVVRERTGGALPGIVPSNTYTCGDGKHLVVAGNGDAIFKRLMLAIDRADLANDPALASNDGRVPQTQRIDEAISAWCSQHNIDEALTHLQAADVPVSKIYSVADMFKDPQFLARGMIEQHQLANGSALKVPAVTPKMSATPGGTRWLGPSIGEHTDRVLSELGYSHDAIATLRDKGAL